MDFPSRNHQKSHGKSIIGRPPVTKARGGHRVVAVHLRAARGQGSVRRGRQGPRGDDVIMAGI